uniref:Actin-related protein 2/3 complex subunit n=1 Tax=Globodera pallida TaxID=36090 RepID=A0A183BQ13_GLOPA
MNAQNNSPVQDWLLNIGPISCHAWNKDRTQLAVSPSNNEIHIFARSDSSWKPLHVLTEHDLLITGLDWAPNTNRLVSCSQDKNAFVWTWEAEKNIWKPEMVLVRANRAATCVKWSPNENKFAVGTGARMVAICYYDRENDWWVAKQIKKPMRSTVTSLDWHPNNILLAVGACDFKARVFSAYVKEASIDEKPAPNPWGTKMPLGELLKEYQSTAWVHDLAFSPSGGKLVWASHDSSISVIDKSNSLQQERPIEFKTAFLPFTSVRWVNETNIVAAGHDCSPILFTFDGVALKLKCKLDVPPESKNGSHVSSAFEMFRSIDKKAVSVDSPLSSTALKTLHQNSIMQIRPHTGCSKQTGTVSKFSTCGLDGVVALWDVQKRLGRPLLNGATSAL